MSSVNITEIKPGYSKIGLEVAELWAHRELLFFMAWRDIKVRYKQTAIGILWAVLQPILTTAVFTAIFSTFAKFDTSEVPYPLFALGGLIIWLFVFTSVTTASNSFVNNTNLVTKVFFPRLILPLASTLAALFDLIFSVVILILLMAYYGVVPNTNLIFAPVFLILAFLTSAALGTLFSALNVRFRDVKFALPFLLQLWMIASPVFYPSSMLSGKLKMILALNPLTGILEGFRTSLFGTKIDWTVIGISCISVLLLTIISLLVFRRMEDDFADLI